MLTDPIADILTRIRNAYAVNKKTVSAPHSKLKQSLVQIILDNGYFKSFEVVGEVPNKTIEISLKYPNKEPAITAITRISKPGVRTYVNVNSLDKLQRGRGITIISTPKGLMTIKKAKNQNLGGEVICKVS